MIKTIVFDFGNVFINLNIDLAMQQALHLFKIKCLTEEMFTTNYNYEQGLISTSYFLEFYKNRFPNISENEIIETWNIILKDFPVSRFNFLKSLSEEKKYRLILLSNTNELHIDWIKTNVSFYPDFKSCFDAFYLSHEIKLRKPSSEIFQFVLNKNNLLAKECLFIDDTKAHILSASKLGINTWHINPFTQDVTQLFEIKKELF